MKQDSSTSTVLLVLLTGVAGFVGAYEFSRDRGERTSPIPEAYRTDIAERSVFEREEIFAVYIGTGLCSVCRSPEMKMSFDSLQARLRRTAGVLGIDVTWLGIAVDPEVRHGLEHLASLGAFDEVALGSGWSNHALFKYVWGTFGGDAVTPQVVLTWRNVEGSRRELQRIERRLDIGAQHVISRLIGREAIASWNLAPNELEVGLAAAATHGTSDIAAIRE